MARRLVDDTSEAMWRGIRAGKPGATLGAAGRALPPAAELGYRGYPKATCISVNNVVCHGIPNEAKVLKDGDILNIVVTVIKDGWHGDTSRMYYAGEPSVMARRLVDATYEAMWRGIRAVKPGATLGDVGRAIQQYAEGERFSVVREYCGHGIDRKSTRLNSSH